MPATRILTGLWGKDVGLAPNDRALVIGSGKIRSRDGGAIEFQTGVGAGDARAYGFVPGSSANQSAILAAAMATCFNDPDIGFLNLEGFGDIVIADEMLVTLTANITWPFGIKMRGSRFVSTINNSSKDVLRIQNSGTPTVRFLTLDGLCIYGSNLERDGLSIIAPTTVDYIYNFTIREPRIENCGRDGMRLQGNVFEGGVYDPYLRDNNGNGLTYGHHASGGIASATSIFGGSIGGNLIGVEIVNNAFDLRMFGTYVLMNDDDGLKAMNGFTLLSGAGFENNWEGESGFAAGKGGVTFQNFGTMVACTGAANNGKMSCLASGYIVSNFVILGHTVMDGQGASAAATLVELDGAGGATADIQTFWGDFLGNFGGVDNVIVAGNVKPQFATPTTGQTITVTGSYSKSVIANPAGALAALTLALPAVDAPLPFTGMRIDFVTAQAITTMTVSHADGVTGWPAGALAANTPIAFVYRKETPEWYRIG